MPAGDSPPGGDSTTGANGSLIDGRACLSTGWCWESPRPHGESFRAAWCGANDELVAIGDSSLATHIDGDSVRVFELVALEKPIRHDPLPKLTAIWGTSGDALWAVGDTGVFTFDGHAWSPAPGLLGRPERVYVDVAGLPDGTVFISWEENGASGVLTVDGSVVTEDEFPAGDMAGVLWAVDASTLLVALGDGRILRSAGGSGWVDQSAPGTGSIHAFWGSGPTDIYSLRSSSLLHFDGSSWTEVGALTLNSGRDVWGTGPNDVYVLDQANVWHYDGSSWRTLYDSANLDGADLSLNALCGPPSEGVLYGVGYLGRVVRWTPTTAESLLPLESSTSWGLSAIWGSADDDIFTVGKSLHHFDGTRWQQQSSPTSSTGWDGMHASSPDDIHVVGHTSYHFDGQSWSRRAALDDMEEIWHCGNGEIWAAGWYDELNYFLQHFDGNSWEPVNLGIGIDAASGELWTWDDIWCAPNGEVYVVDGMRAFHFDGATWAEVSGLNLFGSSSAFGTSPNDVHIMSLPGDINHYDGQAWSRPSVAGVWQFIYVHDIFGTTSDSVYAVGSYGGVFHWDGSSWSFESTGVSHGLDGVWVAPSGRVWAVGGIGIIVSRAP